MGQWCLIGDHLLVESNHTRSIFRFPYETAALMTNTITPLRDITVIYSIIRLHESSWVLWWQMGMWQPALRDNWQREPIFYDRCWVMPDFPAQNNLPPCEWQLIPAFLSPVLLHLPSTWPPHHTLHKLIFWHGYCHCSFRTLVTVNVGQSGSDGPSSKSAPSFLSPL